MTAKPRAITVTHARDLKTLPTLLEGAVAVELLVAADRWKSVATAIGKGSWSAMADLTVVITDFDPRAEVDAPALTAKATSALWASMPSLKRLRLRGHALCRHIEHPTLEVVDADGFVCGEGAVIPGGACPSLHTLRWRFSCDAHNVALEPEALSALWAQRLPKLKTLDLSGADIDGSVVDDVAASPLRTQLEVFGLPSGSSDGWQALVKAAPQLKTIFVTDAALAGIDPRLTVVEASPDDAEGQAAGSDDDDIELNAVDDAGVKKANLLSHAGRLRRLTLSHHDMGDAGAGIIGAVAKAHPELEVLDLNNPDIYGWQASALEAFRVAIGPHDGLKALHLRNNKLVGGGETIARLLTQLPKLEVLELSQTRLSPADLGHVLPAVSRCEHLRVLKVGNLDVDDDVAKLWSAVAIPTLTHLELWTTKFSEEGWGLVFSRLGARLPRLQSLKVTGKPFSTATTKGLCDAFMGHEHFASLELDMVPTTAAYNALGALLASAPISHLLLEEGDADDIDDEAADSDAISALSRARALRSLVIKLDDDDDTDKHLALARALASIPTIRTLSGWSSGEKDLAILKAMADTLASSTVRAFGKIDAGMCNALLRRGTVEAMSIEGGYNFDKKLEYRAPALKTTTSLQTLTLHKGELKKDHVVLLDSILKENTSLQTLNITMAMNQTVAKELAKRMSKIKTLKTMNIGFTTDDDTRDAMAGAVAKGSALKITFEPRPIDGDDQ